MRYLAILLLAPWLLMLCWAYWRYPQSLPRTPRRRAYDVVALLLAASATVQAALLGFDHAALPAVGRFGRASGAIWQQVMPALFGYGAFAVVLLLALWLRQACWGRRPP
ncbi:MAG: hypothetical protein EPN74_08995 [Rhodanobacter sp.]|nr:MAG: hypothetical protein EPN74_08995 [Rhodanobacter sp.]